MDEREGAHRAECLLQPSQIGKADYLRCRLRLGGCRFFRKQPEAEVFSGPTRDERRLFASWKG
jgi:hypothetical protein